MIPTDDHINSLIDAKSPDWNASEGEAGYVKNRTHYEADELFVCWADKTVTSEATPVDYMGKQLYRYGEYEDNSELPWYENGTEVVLVVDGISYNTIVRSDGCGFGDANLVETPVFFTKGSMGWDYVYMANPNETHVISVYKRTGKKIKQLDEKFIPDTIARVTDVPTVPTNVGAFTNDAGYLTSYTETDPTVPSHVKSISTTDISNWNAKAETSDIPTKVSDLENDAEYITADEVPTVTETDPTVPSHVKSITTGDISNWNAKATTNYVDTKVAGIVDTAPEALNTLNELAAALGDDPNFATTVMTEIGKKVDKTTTVNGQALSGNVTITSVNHATTADSATAATTATSAIQDNQGRNIADTYATKSELNSLTIPTVNNATLTIQKNGTTVGSFTANSASNVTANITVPTGAAADKGVDTSISAGSTSTNLPTSKAVAAFVEGKGYKTTDNNTTYTFATGDSNGQIKVTPSGGTAQNVSVKGLGTAAYTASTAYAPAIHEQAASTITGLATVATSGKYSDLTGTPTIPAAANNGTLTIQKNGTTVATFGANQSTATTANITVPTKTSDLTNDSGFKTTDNNTTYSLSKSGSIITLTGSDGSTTSVADSDTNTDTKVTQTVTSSNATYPILLAPSGQTATTTTTSYFDSGVTLNPSTNTIAANISGNSTTANKLATARTINGVSFDGSSSITIYSPYECVVNTAELKTAGWYRVASISSLGTCSTLEWSLSRNYSNTNSEAYQLLVSMAHQTVNFTQINSKVNIAGITKVRLVFLNHSSAAYLEVYYSLNAANNIYSYIRGNAATSIGWTNVAFTAGAIPSGYNSKEFTLSSNSIKADSFEGALIGNASTATTAVTCTGNAATATKAGALTTNAGSATKPVYFSNGVPVAGTYTLGAACAKGVTDSTSASAISTGTNLVTERDVYYGLPKINNSKTYTSSTTIYAPTAGGTSGYVLVGAGTTSAPTWKQSLPIANGGTGATTAAAALTNLGITATAAELNKLDGVTATTTELNYVDGVTSNIQTQLNGKAASGSRNITYTCSISGEMGSLSPGSDFTVIDTGNSLRILFDNPYEGWDLYFSTTDTVVSNKEVVFIEYYHSSNYTIEPFAMPNVTLGSGGVAFSDGYEWKAFTIYYS